MTEFGLKKADIVYNDFLSPPCFVPPDVNPLETPLPLDDIGALFCGAPVRVIK